MLMNSSILSRMTEQQQYGVRLVGMEVIKASRQQRYNHQWKIDPYKDMVLTAE